MSSISDLIHSGSSRLDNQSENSWFEVFAEAWGTALDKQAARIVDVSDQISKQSFDSPAVYTELTAESLRMGFISQSSHTSMTSVATALETLARKQ